MKKYPRCVFVWDGHVMMPTLHFARLAESSFTSGQAYRMIVDEEASHRARRTKEQNDKMWAMLQEISEQVEHCNRRYDPDQWKVLLLHAMGQDLQLLPALDGKGSVVPYGGRSSIMSISQMNEFIEFIRYFGAQHAVVFRDDLSLEQRR